ncbi:hypothetical protein [Streptomyces sp. NPDC088350]|uniref:hypothetical protein n=1 Tax=Streptomyces sp. NPDC088350 TaxID=3365854 RepID=UPI00381D3587
MLRLPGRSGDFLLDAEQVGVQLPAAEEAFALTGAQRRAAIERIHMWMTGLGDGKAGDSQAFVDWPPVRAQGGAGGEATS